MFCKNAVKIRIDSEEFILKFHSTNCTE